MGIYTWIFGRAQAEAQNFGSLQISNDDISLVNFFAGSTNYLQLVADGIDRYGGQAFITEYAQPSNQLQVVDPLLQELRQQYPYVTRLYGQMSPNEMTVDPIFDFNNNLSDVSNVRDLSYRTDLYPCTDDSSTVPEPAPNTPVPDVPTPSVSAPVSNEGFLDTLGLPGIVAGALFATCLILLGAAVGGGIVLLSRRK